MNSAAFGLLALAVAIAAARSMRPEKSPSVLNTAMWVCIIGSTALHCMAALNLTFLSQGGSRWRFALASSAVAFGLIASIHVVRAPHDQPQPLAAATAAGVAVYLLYTFLACVAGNTW